MLRRHREMAAEAINKKSITPTVKWSEGQQVWLEARNISLIYGSSKLAPRRHGPFKILRVISPVAYELELPKHWKIHPVFHASLLTPYVETVVHSSNFLRPPPDIIDGQEEYEVEQILSHRTFGCQKQLQYLVKWKGYLSSDNTWEPAGNLHADDLIQEYRQRTMQLQMTHSQGICEVLVKLQKREWQ